MTDNLFQAEPYAAAVRQLLKGVVYYDDDPKVWSQIRTYTVPLREYLHKIGLILYLDEGIGFAYLAEESGTDDNKNELPPITMKRQLSFSVTLLLVLLRERLEEHTSREVEYPDLRLSYDDIQDMLSVFMGEHPDARRIQSITSNAINRAVDYGFLKKLDRYYLVRPVLRAKINIDALQSIKISLYNLIHKDGVSPTDDHDEPV